MKQNSEKVLNLLKEAQEFLFKGSAHKEQPLANDNIEEVDDIYEYEEVVVEQFSDKEIDDPKCEKPTKRVHFKFTESNDVSVSMGESLQLIHDDEEPQGRVSSPGSDRKRHY